MEAYFCVACIEVLLYSPLHIAIQANHLVYCFSVQSAAGVGVLNSKLYMIGGYNGQRAERSCEVYNPSTQTWSAIAKLSEGKFLCGLLCTSIESAESLRLRVLAIFLVLLL